jgi:hypothetical protein
MILFFFLGNVFPEFFAIDQTRDNRQATAWLYSLIGLVPYAIFESFCLNIFCTTFGKFLYGITIMPESGDHIALSAALKRSFAVFYRGEGLGFPIISLVTAFVAYNTLEKERQTSWDRDFSLIVLHSKLSISRCLVIAIVWFLLVGTVAFLLVRR